jgi:hypothetical protein
MINTGTEPTDVDTDVEESDRADLAWILGEDNSYSPDYYLNQENNSG